MNNSASASRRTWNRVMNALVWASAVLVIVLVAGILGMVLVRGIPHISWKFLTTTASVLKGTDGILPAILNTLYVILLTLLIVLPLGVGAAVYLTEYAQNRKVISVIEFTNETLAGIPSIIYGLVGMLVFAQTLGFQTCLLSGSLTLVIMNLPTIIRNTGHHTACIHHMRAFFSFLKRHQPDKTILRLKSQVDTFRKVVWHQCRQSDTKIHNISVL